jgi:hypothetical protein
VAALRGVGRRYEIEEKRETRETKETKEMEMKFRRDGVEDVSR